MYQLIFPNGRSYIGITVKTAEQRFRGHCESAARGITDFPNLSRREKALLDKKYGFDNFGRLQWLTPLGQAIREYGRQSVVIKTLVIADDVEYLKELEIKAIKRYRTLYDPFSRYGGYNISKGDCPKDIDYIVKTKKWRATLKPVLPWPRGYFKNEPVYIADFDTLGDARRKCDEVRREEYRRWMECMQEPS